MSLAAGSGVRQTSLYLISITSICSRISIIREKVFIRTSPVLKRSRLRKRKKRRTRPHVEEQVMLRSESCPYCGGNDLRENHDGRLARLVMDLKVSPKGIRRRWIEVVSYRHLCLGCRRFCPSRLLPG